MNETIPPQMTGAVTPTKTSALAITSLVFGILSIVLACIAPIFGIPAIICGHIAYSRIRHSGGQLAGAGLAMAGFITGYVSLALIVLMLPIAIPNFIKARDTAMQNACISNLRAIDNAKQQWALENKKSAGTTPTENDLLPYLPHHQMPKCAAGGTYTIGPVDTAPTCSVPNHKLP